MFSAHEAWKNINLLFPLRSGQHETLSIPRFANQSTSFSTVHGPAATAVQPAAGTSAAAFADAQTPATTPATVPAAAQALADPAAPVATPVATEPAQAAGADAPQSLEADNSLGMAHDLSPWGMYKNADIIVKIVMIGLAIASIITWTIWIAEGFELLGAKRRLRGEIAALKKATTLKEASVTAAKAGTLANLLVHDAARRDPPVRPTDREKEGIKERVSFRLERLVAALWSLYEQRHRRARHHRRLPRRSSACSAQCGAS